MVVAVIVTYNRKMELCKNLQMLYAQTIRIDKIIVVDNCSTDGTWEKLNEDNYLKKDNFQYLKTRENVGGAGGFFVGTKAAYELGADWIVLMDDDGCPDDEETFEKLLTVAEQLHKKNVAEKKIFINALVQKDEMLSFKIDNIYTVSEAIGIAKNGIIENAANPFNGTVVSRELVAEIGYPNKDFFIKGDEVDYKQRAFDAGAYVATVVAARYNHPRPAVFERVVLGIKVPFFVEAPWKEYYTARNFTYMYKKKKQYKAILFELIFVKILAVMSTECKKRIVIRYIFKGVRDGWLGKLGATVKP